MKNIKKIPIDTSKDNVRYHGNSIEKLPKTLMSTIKIATTVPNEAIRETNRLLKLIITVPPKSTSVDVS